MLNREDSVIADCAESRNKISPELRVMPVAKRAICPNEVSDRLSRLKVEDPLYRDIVGLDPCIFGMDVADRVAKCPNYRKRVHSLEEEMAWIEIGGHYRAQSGSQPLE